MRIVSDEAWAVMTIWMEARGETYHGKLAVAEVVRNRTRRRYSSDGTVASTVLTPFQFSGWMTKDPNRIPSAKIDDADPVVADCVKAWREALAGSNLVRNALLYYAPAVVVEPDWVSRCTRVATIGAHQFYVPKDMHVA